MLRNSNSSQSFQIRTFKNNRVITSNINVTLKLERSFYDDFFKQYCLHRLTNKLSNEHLDTMLILCFFDSPNPKVCKSTKNWRSKICMITKVPHA